LVLAAEIICVLTGMLPLIVGYTQSRLFPVVVGCFVIGLFWIYSERRRWHWGAPAVFFVFVSAAGAGVWIGQPPILMALSVLGSLMAWDLAGFSRRSKGAAPEDNLRGLDKNHLIQLAGLGAVSLVFILASLLIHLRISFGWIFLLVLAAIFGIMQMVRRYRG
jgi:hypothetical protein